MNAPSSKVSWFDDRLRLPLSGDFGPHYKEFEEVAVALLNGYAKFVRHGMPGATIAHAMMEATINFHRLFGTSSELPTLLRGLADQIEHEHRAQKN